MLDREIEKEEKAGETGGKKRTRISVQ